MKPADFLTSLDKGDRTWLTAAIAVMTGLLILRIIALLVDPHSLYADETQYWLWSQNLDWGYYSKPPMIAWMIWATTSIFGDADWAVRLSSPFLHTLSALFLGLAANKLFDLKTGALTAMLWVLMPAVWLSSNLISTDVVLMMGWSLGLFALVSLRCGASWKFALLLGFAAAWAFLAKYAAIYFLLGTVIAILIDAPTRRALLSTNGLIALITFLGLISPNVIWNAAHDFATVSHTAANANWGNSLFHPDELGQFIIDQLGVFGPLFFPVLIFAAYKTLSDKALLTQSERPHLLLLGFILPALIMVGLQAFISRAHANWAASAYGAGTILLASFILIGPSWRRIVLWSGMGLHTVAGLMLFALSVSTPLSDAAGLANAFKRMREWPETMQALHTRVEAAGVDYIVFDNRNDFHQFQRYGTNIPAQPFMWLRHAGPLNFAETTWPLPDSFTEPVLIASERPREIPLLERDFEHFEPYGEIRIPLGNGRERHYLLFIAHGHVRQNRDSAYEAWVSELRDQR